MSMDVKKMLAIAAVMAMMTMTSCGESSQSDSIVTTSSASSHTEAVSEVSNSDVSSSDETTTTTTVTSDTSSDTVSETTTASSETTTTNSEASDKVKKNSDGRYEYLVAGRYTIACKTNIYDYVFSAGKYDNFIDLTRMSKDIGFEQAARLTTGKVDPNMAVAFRYSENGAKKFGIGFDHENSSYREGMFTEDYDKNHGTGSGYTIHFKNDDHSNNYWTGSVELKTKNVLRTSLSFDQIVLIVKGMEEAVAGNESDDWIIASGITKPKGYSHFYIYY